MTERTITAYEGLQFGPIAGGSPVEAAVLWGNGETGPAASMIRLSEGYQKPWHSHTTTYHSVLVKGEFRTPRKDTAVTESEVFGPGAYTVQPGGAVHSLVITGSSESVAFVLLDGPVDFVPAE